MNLYIRICIQHWFVCKKSVFLYDLRFFKYKSKCVRICKFPLTRKWHTPPQPTTKFPNSGADKRGIRFIRRSTTLSAITQAVDGIKPRLFNPSHLPLPCASVGGPGSVLRRAHEELRQSPPFQNWANIGRILGCCQHQAPYFAPIDPPAHWSPITTRRDVGEQWGRVRSALFCLEEWCIGE